jgi:hypothetical protein
MRNAGAKEPSCVCNWGATPRACFLAEVQKHPKLMIEAKILEDSIKQKQAQILRSTCYMANAVEHLLFEIAWQEIRQEEARISRIVRRDQAKFSNLIDRGHEVHFARCGPCRI